MNYEAFSSEVYEWSKENFGEAPCEYPLIGAGEEAGELTTSVLKRAQGIDDADKYDGVVGDEAERDAVGDIETYLVDMEKRRENESGKPPREVMDILWFYVHFGRLCETVVRNRGDMRFERELYCTRKALDDFCKSRDFYKDECIEDAWEEVSGRTWDSDVKIE